MKRWDSGPDLMRNLLYAGSVTVPVPAECVQEGSKFVAIPSRAGVDGFIVFDVNPEDLAPEGADVVRWEIVVDRRYRAMRTAGKKGVAVLDQDGVMTDEACFDGAAVLEVYLTAASESDPEALLAWAFEQSGKCVADIKGRIKNEAPAENQEPVQEPVQTPPERACMSVPEELVLPGRTGFGIVFPDPDAMGGIGLIGGPDVSYQDGRLDLGEWCSPVWRLVNRTLTAVPAAYVVHGLVSALELYQGAAEPKRRKFLSMKPGALPPWPSFHGRVITLSGLPLEAVRASDLPGTVQAAVSDRSSGSGFGFVLVPVAAVNRLRDSMTALLGRSDMPVLYMRDGVVSVRTAGDLDAVVSSGILASGRRFGGFGTIRLGGISRMSVREDYGSGMCDLEFRDKQGAVCGVRVPDDALEDGDDGLLTVDLGGPESPVRFYRVAGDGIREGASMTAGGIARILDKAVNA